MRQLKSILLPIDFRPASNAAAQVAASLAQRFGSRLTVLHVVDAISTRPTCCRTCSKTVTGCSNASGKSVS